MSIPPNQMMQAPMGGQLSPTGPTPEQMAFAQAQFAAQQAQIQQAYLARKQEIQDQFPPFVRALRDRRRPIEDTHWLPNLDCWKAKHRNQGFQSDWFNHYIPVARRSVERFVKRCKQMLFTAPDPFEVYPAVEADPNLGAQSEAIRNYLSWRLWRCRFRSTIAQVLRSMCLTQRGIVKLFVDAEDVPGQVWPSVRAVDPFSFYVWPETATSISEAQVLVEHSMVPFEHYHGLVALSANTQWPFDPINKEDLTKPEWPVHIVERLSKSGLSTPTDVPMGGEENEGPGPIAMLAVTEQWVRKGPGWEQSWLVWNITAGPKCVRLTTQPIAPYRMAIDRQVPGEHYTNAMMDDLEPLNRLFNDQTNMTCEAGATSIFPPALINPSLVARTDSLVFRPRAKWLVDDTQNAVQFGTVPNTAGAGYQGMQMTMGMMDSFSGSSPLAEGTPTRGMPRAGFAISSLIGLAMSDIRDMAELVEDEILTPMLADLHRMTVDPTFQIPAQQLVSIPGAEGVSAWRGTVQQLYGAVSFRWVGTLQAQDQMQRSQRMLTLLGQLAKFYPMMLQQGYKIDFISLGKRLWRDAMGERGADTIIQMMSPQERMAYQQQQAMQQQQGQPQHLGGGPNGPVPHAPVSAEGGQRQMSRQMSESGAGQMMAGTGSG